MDRLTNDMYRWAYEKVNFVGSVDVYDLELEFWNVIHQEPNDQILSAVFSLSQETINEIKKRSVEELAVAYSLSFRPKLSDVCRLQSIRHRVKSGGHENLIRLARAYWQTLASVLAKKEIDYCALSFGLDKDFVSQLSEMSFITISRHSNTYLCWELMFNQHRFVKRLQSQKDNYSLIRFIDSLTEIEA